MACIFSIYKVEGMLVVNKNFFNSISVSKNSDKIISSTQDSFAAIRSGSYIKIGDLDILYSIINSKNFFYSKEFRVLPSRVLKISSHTNTFLQRDDAVKITYDEYKLDYILNIVNGGQFYTKGDILIVNGGSPSINLVDGNIFPTKLIVEEINPDGGAVQRLSLHEPGKYITPPTGTVTLSGGHGESLLLELKYSIIDNRNIEERLIKDIQFVNNETLLTLDYPLPSSVEMGRLSLEKWEAQLSVPYLGETALNIGYKIFQDFTLNYKLPLIVKNNPDYHLIINNALIKIDQEIKKLESLIISS